MLREQRFDWSIWRGVLSLRRAIKYFCFWDVPRTFVFEWSGQLYILTSEFDDKLDESSDQYEVFVVSGVRVLSEVSDWKSIEPLPQTALGRVSVSSVRCDTSNRKYVESSFLGELLK
jgi:hypothetical protein